MNFSLNPDDVIQSTKVKNKPYAIGLIVLLSIFLIGLALIASFATSQRMNVLLVWQQTLSGVADVRASAISEWVNAQKAPIKRFAADQEVRLSVAQIADPSADLDLESRSYLRNWVTNLARENKYITPTLPTGGSDQAAAEAAQKDNRAGVAVILKSGDILVSTGSIARDQSDIKSFVDGYGKDLADVMPPFKGKDGAVYIGFAAPIYNISGTETEDNRLGLILAVKKMDPEVWPLLRQPGSMIKSGEALLLRPVDGAVQILSPTRKNGAMEVQRALDSQKLIEAEALSNTGGFAAGQNYDGTKSYGVSRRVEGTPWVLSYQADYKELMGESDRQTAYQSVIFAALLFLVLAFLYAAWKNGAARIAADKALEYAALARRYAFQTHLLRLITDSQRNHILIADTEGRVRFANAPLSRAMGVEAEDLVGKPLAAAVGAETARRFARRSQEASLSNKAVVTVDRIEPNVSEEDATSPAVDAIGGFRVVQTQHIPLEDRSNGPDQPALHGTLIVEEDITDLVMEREKRERILRAVVDAMLSVVDRRDPYAAQHSSRVGRLARVIAKELRLSDVDTEAAELGGALLNLGKLLVPPQILTKQGQLDDAELKIVRDSLLTSASIMEQIEFNGPVVATMRQSMEKVDGSGFPDGLVGDAILLPARIVAVANAFVALVSARAHRPGLSVDKALDLLMASADKAYDRGVVAALVNYLDNKGGRAEWGNTEIEAEAQAPQDDNPWQR